MVDTSTLTYFCQRLPNGDYEVLETPERLSRTDHPRRLAKCASLRDAATITNALNRK